LKVDSLECNWFIFLYLPIKGVKGETKIVLKVLEAMKIFLKADDSFKLLTPILLKSKKLIIFFLSKGNIKVCAGVIIASLSLF
jgi:hypothetical protein